MNNRRKFLICIDYQSFSYLKGLKLTEDKNLKVSGLCTGKTYKESVKEIIKEHDISCHIHRYFKDRAVECKTDQFQQKFHRTYIGGRKHKKDPFRRR